MFGLVTLLMKTVSSCMKPGSENIAEDAAEDVVGAMNMHGGVNGVQPPP